MSENIYTITAGQTPPCLQQKIDKARYLVDVYFNDKSSQSVEDKLKRVILHDLENGKQGKLRRSDERFDTSLTSCNRNCLFKYFNELF